MTKVGTLFSGSESLPEKIGISHIPDFSVMGTDYISTFSCMPLASKSVDVRSMNGAALSCKSSLFWRGLIMSI